MTYFYHILFPLTNRHCGKIYFMPGITLQKKSFKEEYFEIPGNKICEFKEKYLFEFYCDTNDWD